VELQRPKLRGTDQACCSRLVGAGVTRTHALESLVISGWVGGRSDRDIQATLAEVLGPEAALSKSTVSRIGSAIGEAFTAWRTRELSGCGWTTGSLLPATASCIPAPRPSRSWPLGRRCRRHAGVGGLAPAASESTDAGDDFLADLVGRAGAARCWGSATARPG
jgi:hypothetical protein